MSKYFNSKNLNEGTSIFCLIFIRFLKKLHLKHVKEKFKIIFLDTMNIKDKMILLLMDGKTCKSGIS